MNEVGALKDKKQIEKLKAILRKNGHRDYLLFVMGINLGLRIVDLLNLKFESVSDGTNGIANSIKIKEQKTGKTKTFYVNDTVRRALAEFIRSTPHASSDYIFASRKGGGKPISRIQAYRIINEACYHARIKGSIGTHTLRKTFGYWAHKQGIDITLLMKIFNHSSPSITQRYIGITDDEI